ncbi:hypothetical protein [Streptomyces sp. NPDC055056]
MMMTWADFWALIETLNGATNETGCDRLIAELSNRPALNIQGFAERAAEALWSKRSSAPCPWPT